MEDDQEARDCRAYRHEPKCEEDFRKVPCRTCNPTGEPLGPYVNWAPRETAPPLSGKEHSAVHAILLNVAKRAGAEARVKRELAGAGGFNADGGAPNAEGGRQSLGKEATIGTREHVGGQDWRDKFTRHAEAVETLLAGGHVEGQGWRMEYLRLLARARADGILTIHQIKSQLPADLLLAVEALAEELRGGSHVMPLVVLGNDWDFGGEEDQYVADQIRLDRLRLQATIDKLHKRLAARRRPWWKRARLHLRMMFTNKIICRRDAGT